MQTKIYYYNFKTNYAWLIFNIIFTLLMVYGFLYCQMEIYTQSYVLLGVLVFSWGVWWYKYVHKQVMVVVNDESIKIDHTQPLKWKDVAKAEERIVQCCGRKKVIVLIAKEGIDYKYNFLQKHNADFTPFSIPLYGILTPEDEKELTELVAKKVKLTKLK